MKSEKTYKFAVRFVSAAQGLILALGLLGGCFLAVYQVMHKIRSPGDFVVLLTYWAQLKGM
jgi:ABC-type transport system involved in Fe-S cluster assembly fused permease/ATPase subunit